jgi:hypothetical protein
MAVYHELEEAVKLVEAVDRSIRVRFPEGSLERLAWDRLKANVSDWQAQQTIKDPFVALMRARELEHEFKNIVALFGEAGFDFD